MIEVTFVSSCENRCLKRERPHVELARMVGIMMRVFSKQEETRFRVW